MLAAVLVVPVADVTAVLVVPAASELAVLAEFVAVAAVVAPVVAADVPVVVGTLVVVTGAGGTTVVLPRSERLAWRNAPNRSCRKACRS